MNSNMEYRFLGNTGLKVSCLSLGNWLTADDINNEKKMMDVIDTCFQSGVNYFDTAEMYAAGIGETILGNCLKKLNLNRSDYVVSTKIWKCAMPAQSPSINGLGLSRKHIIEGMNGSLKRLQLDYVDLVYCHRYDHETPMEEVCKAMNYLIDSGKCFYWGTSEWTADQIMEAMVVCEKYDLIKPVIDQSLYNMFYRDRIETEYLSLYKQYKYGIATYASLAGGILTGKYNQGDIPEDSRGSTMVGSNTRMFKELLGKDRKEDTLKKCKALADLSKEMNCTQAQLALAWVLANSDISTLIFGAKNVDQAKDNLKALEVYQRWTPELDRKIEEILQSRPKPRMNWKAWKPFEPRRQI